MKLYHATGTDYQQGNDLLSLLARVEQGWLTEGEALTIAGRWGLDEDTAAAYLVAGDGAMVSLTADLAEARYIREEWNGGQGVILEIDGDALAEEGLLRTNSEGYPAVASTLPGWAILGTTD